MTSSTNAPALAADQLLKRFRIEGPPVHVAEILDNLGVSYRADRGYRRALVKDVSGGGRELVYNPDQPAGNRRVDAGHELGHIVLGHLSGGPAVLFAHGRGTGTNWDTKRSADEIAAVKSLEAQADTFSIHLLAPFEWVSNAVCCIGIRAVGELAVMFGVTPKFMWQALRRYNLHDLVLWDTSRLERYLASAQWKARRADIMARRPECERCGRSRYETTLYVHHLNYKRLGSERDSDLAVLCREHHLLAHGREDQHPGQLELLTA